MYIHICIHIFTLTYMYMYFMCVEMCTRVLLFSRPSECILPGGNYSLKSLVEVGSRVRKIPTDQRVGLNERQGKVHTRRLNSVVSENKRSEVRNGETEISDDYTVEVPEFYSVTGSGDGVY